MGYLDNLTDYAGFFRITFSLADETGAKLGTAMDIIEMLKPADRWKFRASYCFQDGVRKVSLLSLESRRGEVPCDFEWRDNEKWRKELSDAGLAERIAQERRNAERDRINEEVAHEQRLSIEQQKREREGMRKSQEDARTLDFLTARAEKGSASAACSLGLRYLNGNGAKPDKAQAIRWLTIAASAGNLEASNALARAKE